MGIRFSPGPCGCCVDCGCTGKMPDRIIATISNVADVGFKFSILNGDYILLPKFNASGLAPPSACIYGIDTRYLSTEHPDFPIITFYIAVSYPVVLFRNAMLGWMFNNAFGLVNIWGFSASATDNCNLTKFAPAPYRLMPVPPYTAAGGAFAGSVMDLVAEYD